MGLLSVEEEEPWEKTDRLRWSIAAFKHPEQNRSVLYRHGLHISGLVKAVQDAVDKGANLMSIRGLEPEVM